MNEKWFQEAEGNNGKIVILYIDPQPFVDET